MTASPGAGSSSSAAREAILARIRTALGPERAVFEVPSLSSLARADPPQGEALVERFAERVADYRATVVVTTPNEAADTVEAACQRHRVLQLGVPAGFDTALVPDDVTAVPVTPGARDSALAFGDLDALVAVAPLGVAETGTIVFDAGAGQGPRAASLLPDVLICVIHSSALVAGVGDAIGRMRKAVDDGGRPLTMVSGPSATSDIELDRVEGVHGPRVLEVIVVRAAD